MIKVIAEDFIKEEFLHVVAPLYKELVAATKLENNCIEYNLYVDKEDKTHFIFIEKWVSEADLDAHCSSEHFTRLVPLIDQHQYKRGTAIIMELYEGEQ